MERDYTLIIDRFVGVGCSVHCGCMCVCVFGARCLWASAIVSGRVCIELRVHWFFGMLRGRAFGVSVCVCVCGCVWVFVCVCVCVCVCV